MDAKILVIITGAILVIAILVSLAMMRRNPNRFTYDTAHGTRPRASEGEGNTSQVAFKGRFTMLTAGVGAVFAAIFAKLWSMQMVSSHYYEELSNQNQTRTVTTPAPRGRILDRNGTPLVTNRPCLTVAAYRSLAEDTVTVRHLANVLGMPYIAVKRNIQNYNESAPSASTRMDRLPVISLDIRVPSRASSSKSKMMMRTKVLQRLPINQAISLARPASSCSTSACFRAFAASRPFR